VEEVHARAALGVSANASQREIEAAYSHRVSEPRKQFKEAKDHRTREKCRRKSEDIDEARRLLLDPEEEDRRQREENERLGGETGAVESQHSPFNTLLCCVLKLRSESFSRVCNQVKT
jgi:DnaJ-class molecular chaperone